MIKKEELVDLLSIIPKDYPSIEIFHISDRDFELCEALQELAIQKRYGYDLEFYLQSIDEKLKKKYNNIRVFDIDKHRYNRHAKIYDFVFVTIDLEEIKNLDLFLKKLYNIIKNSGKILFILNKESDLGFLEEKLIDKNYVAINEITNTFTNYKILSAQKMHGWGS